MFLPLSFYFSRLLLWKENFVRRQGRIRMCKKKRIIIIIHKKTNTGLSYSKLNVYKYTK